MYKSGVSNFVITKSGSTLKVLCDSIAEARMVETVALQIMQEDSVLRVPNVMRYANEYARAELRQRMGHMTSREHASTSGTPNKGQAYLAPNTKFNTGPVKTTELDTPTLNMLIALCDEEEAKTSEEGSSSDSDNDSDQF